LLLALAAFGSMLTPFVARALTSLAGLVGVAVLVVLVALPHVGLLGRPETVGEFFPAVVIVIVGCLVLLRRELTGRAGSAESATGLVDGSEASRIVSTA
jgi:hypothetical protein